MRQIWKQRYQIMEKLGKGGTGQVYRVWDLHLGKEWALKEMEEENSGEAEILKQLSNKAFPRIVDAFWEAGKQILIMDYIQGITLEEVLKQGPLEEKKIVKLAKQVAQALLSLHERTPVLLYMDLKPANLILEEGEVKLVDLGSIMIKGKSRQVSGTLGFASPEQIQLWQGGRLLTERSDIFSFGMLLFSMLTGRIDRMPAVDKKSRYGVLARRYNPLVSPALERIIEKCTRGTEERRYSSIRDVYQQLELWEKKLNKGKNEVIYRKSLAWFFLHRQWQQKKSILCTQGKSALYIAGRNMLVFILLGLCLSLWSIPATHSMAKEKENEKLKVMIRDMDWRKVLVREGGVWETKDNLLFEIPWEEIEMDSCQITIFCTGEKGRVKSFNLQCQRKY
ncbi:MAG: serine/threonine protein kinase [Lachnospiraceae bacterium]|nr:serine/threonine protein kinase [Lachnospiraceae bacterium]